MILADSVCAQLFVGSALTTSVKRFDATNGAFQLDIPTVAIPVGFALASDGMLYLAQDGNGGQNAIYRMNPTSGSSFDLFSSGGSLNSPDALAIGPGNDLFLVDNVHSDVRRFDGGSGAFESVFASQLSQLFTPRGLVFTPNNKLLVASQQNNKILAFNGTTGVYQGEFAAGANLSPHGLAVGPGGDVFVSSFLNDQVLRFDGATGVSEGVFANGNGLDGPTGLTFGPDGDLFVSSYFGDRVLRFDGTTGAFEGVFASGNGLDGPLYLLFVPVPEPSLCLIFALFTFPMIARHAAVAELLRA